MTPLQKRLLTVLESTPGVVTDEMIKWQLWGRLGKPRPGTIHEHVSAIRDATDFEIVRVRDNDRSVRGYHLIK